MNLLQINNLAYCPPSENKKILSGVNVSLTKGTITAVMGLNGAGKTTFLKLMSGFLKPTEGVVLLKDQKLAELSSKEIAQNISFVPQDFPTDFPFTVREFILMGRFAWQQGLSHNQSDYEIVAQILEQLHLQNFAERILPTLSGGERQRVLLARALAQQTEIILLDEPTNHMDIKYRLETFRLIRKLHQHEGKTIVAVIHDLSDARQFFENVILLKEGRLVFSGSTAEGLSPALVKEVFEVVEVG